MNIATLTRILGLRRRLRGHEGWPATQVSSHQLAELQTLRRFAGRRSSFYRTFHRGLERAPLAELPVLTKATLMDNFDRISTEPAVRLAELERYLDVLTDDRRFRGRYWVSATSGSSGRRSVIASNAHEWATVIASYGRANEWTGISVGLRHRVRMAVVSSTKAWHQSARVAATVRGPLVFSERFDAASSLSEIVAGLNELQPDVLVAYASMIRALAGEQLAGRLGISPRAVNSSSEVLTPEARVMATQAWRVPPFNVYAATETGGIAAECSQHQGMHLFEDLLIPEVVDEEYRPVPDGLPGDRLLVTVLFSRTLPLIRYELTDRIKISTATCRCGLPFRLIEAVEGRTDDVLSLPARTGGLVRLHPVIFHKTLDLIDAAGWQVRQHRAGLRILVASPGPGFESAATEHAVRAAVVAAGASTPKVTVSVVGDIPSGAAGKRPLVVASPQSDAQGPDAPPP